MASSGTMNNYTGWLPGWRPVLAISTLLYVASIAAANDADQVLGTYWLPDKDGQLAVYKQDGRYFGRISAYDVAGQRDEKNPDKTLQSRPIVGVNLFKDFAFDADKARWVDGTIYDAKSGKTYKCRLWFEDGDRRVLWARGFIGFSLLGRTEKFERVGAQEN